MTTRTGNRKPFRTATQWPGRAEATPCDQAMQVRMQHQGLTPRVQRRDDARLSTEILGGAQQGTPRVARGLKQQRAHHRHIGQPQGMQIMGQREDHMGVITGEQPRLLESQPALSLERGALGTGPVPTRIVPDAGHVAIRTGLDMLPEGRGPALHDGTRGAPNVAGQRMSAFIVGIARTKDVLQGYEPHVAPSSTTAKRVSSCFRRSSYAIPAPCG